MSARHSPDDGTLVLAVQRGDGDAFAELFRRHYPSVHRACCRRLSDPLEADEVAQAAFVRAFERIAQCAGERRFGPWVHVIARSLCIDSFRAQARVEPWEHPPVGEPELRPEGPEESLLRDERAAELQQALASLPDRQRRAVIARDYDELGPGEIADRLGVTVGAVDSLLLRARRRLALAYRRRAGEGGGGTTVLPVRSTGAAIAVAAALAPQAVMTGTAAAAHAVQGGMRRAGGVLAAVASLAAGIAGQAAPEPLRPHAPAPAVAEAPVAVAVAVANTVPPVTVVVHEPVPREAAVAEPVVDPPAPGQTTAAPIALDQAGTAAVSPTVVTTATGPPAIRPTPSTTVTTPEVTVPARPTVEVVMPTVPAIDTVPRPTVPGRP